MLVIGGLSVASVDLAVALAAFAWMDYAHPAWWRELWKPGDQFEFDVRPGDVVINWNDPDIEVVIEISNHQETEIPAISEMIENGWASSSRESPFQGHLIAFQKRAIKQFVCDVARCPGFFSDDRVQFSPPRSVV